MEEYQHVIIAWIESSFEMNPLLKKVIFHDVFLVSELN
jgi:hypothetical protein